MVFWAEWHSSRLALTDNAIAPASSRKRVSTWLIGLAILLLVLSLCFDESADHDVYIQRSESGPRTWTTGDYDGREVYKQVFAPILGDAPLPATAFLENTTPLNPASVCVLSADSRPLDLGWQEDGRLAMGTASLLSQMAWAFRHGYQYRRLRTNTSWTSETHWQTWDKLPPLLDAVRTCQWTVFMDSDVFLNEPSWSLDDMRARWGIHDAASIFTANDPPRSFNLKTSNTGFMIVQRTAKSILTIEKLLTCPDDIADCAIYRTKWAHEQTAFELFIAHKYLKPGVDHIRGSCEEANGFWNFSGAIEHNCAGKIVAHPWAWKAEISESIQRLFGLDMMRALLRLFTLDSTLRAPFVDLMSADFDLAYPKSIQNILRQAHGLQPSLGRAASTERVCVLAVDGRQTAEHIRRTQSGFPFEADGIDTASLLQLAYALRHGYEYRRLMLPAFPRFDLHGSWRSVEPLVQTVQACDTTIYFGPASYPLDLDSDLGDLRRLWDVAPQSELILISQSENSSRAAFDFAIIKRTSTTVVALQKLSDCQADEACLDVASHNEFLNPEHLSVVWNEVDPSSHPFSIPAGAVHLVAPCARSQAQACNSQLSTPIDARWYATVEEYTAWSSAMAKEAVESLGREVMRFLLQTWSTFPDRHKSYAVRSAV